jgi:hypothetical protein
MICESCGGEFFEDWRKDKALRRKVLVRFCSRACANRRVQSKEVNERRRLAVQKYRKEHPRELKSVTKSGKPIPTIGYCIMCGGEVFRSARGYLGKFCSKACENYFHSLHRQQVLNTKGPFSTQRRLFEYKGVTVECDSFLEEAGVVYLVDVLGAKCISRYENILNFYEGEAHRTFNPDFWVIGADNTPIIVEVKMLWLEGNSHSYNRNIPLKKIALKRFCDSKGFGFIWLDFDYDLEFKRIYRAHLKARNLE